MTALTAHQHPPRAGCCQHPHISAALDRTVTPPMAWTQCMGCGKRWMVVPEPVSRPETK